MGPTWRERIVRARERGGFTRDDRKRAASPLTCAWAEMNDAYGLGLKRNGLGFADSMVERQGWAFYLAVDSNAVEQAEVRLIAIEDAALELKRAAS
jgi:hypothetical protein